MDVAEALAEIGAGPAGPEVGAFFDLDGTLVSGYTAGTVFADRLRYHEIAADEFVRTLLANVDGTWLGGDPTAGAGPPASGARGGDRLGRSTSTPVCGAQPRPTAGRNTSRASRCRSRSTRWPTRSGPAASTTDRRTDRRTELTPN